ncbi:MAG: diadenylate cyclase CdaA [Bacteroidales bacterium]|nr:TIGR00159 family protein [Bacteroidales bacterium]MBR2475565.1 diadenylate cyclase CdaA [Bacteroidaceae bacterium]MBR3608721.1 diadenylate cyclase CdaA [Bacteroidales bacterium]
MFTTIGIKDIIDIFLVSIILYYVYRVMRVSGTIKIFGGIIAFIVIWILVSRIFEMQLLGSIMDKLVNVGVIILVILFQDDIRIFLSELGSHKSWKRFTNFFKAKKSDTDEVPEYVMHIVYACKNMSQTKTGALIVVKQDMPLVKYEATGEKINAEIESRLIETIFYKGTPLHDGAIIIGDGKIIAASCILPVSHAPNIPRELGLRHRSALGITQETDAVAVIVSEERGEISFAKNGKISRNITTQALERMLSISKNR